MPRWVAPTFVLLAVLTLPWIAYLAVTLPHRQVSVNYRAAWVGFDAGLVVTLLATGYQAWRGSHRLAVAASATATLLVVDAWFDVVTTPAPDLYLSIALAVLVEVPLAVVCLWLSVHSDDLVERRMRYLARRAARAEAVAGVGQRPWRPALSRRR